MGNFYEDVVRKDPRYYLSARCADLSLLEPGTRSRVLAVLDEAASRRVHLAPYETYRSLSRQFLLYKHGATKLRDVGVHHYALAVDLVREVSGEPSWKGDFSILGELGRKHGLVWGGDWGEPDKHHSFVDAVHLQRVSVVDQGRLFAGSFYPDDAYDPYA
jgi:hypothetical protein